MDRRDPEDVLASLEAAFGAAVARDEQTAAADLAVTLFQDRNLADVLGRGGPWDVVLEGRRVRLDHVAADFVVAENFLVPLERALIVRAHERTSPSMDCASLLGALRRVARRRARVRIAAGGEPWEGVLTACGRDFVAVATRRDERLLPLAAVAWVQVTEEPGRDG